MRHPEILTSVCILQEVVQLPPVFGSMTNVSEANYLPRNLEDFVFSPGSSNYRAPHGWRGKLMLLFVLKDGTEYSKVQGYVRSEIAPHGIEVSREAFQQPLDQSWREKHPKSSSSHSSKKSSKKLAIGK